MKITIGISDDSRIQVEFIKDCIEKMNLSYEIDFVLSFTGKELLDSSKIFDIVFLDIEMGDVNGIEVGKEIHKKSPNAIIIFITGYKQYALEAFEINSFQYCIKPVSITKVEGLVNKAIIRLNEKKAYEDKINSLTIKNRDEITTISYDDIYYIEKCWKKVKVHCKNDTYEMYCSIKELIKKIDKNIFHLCHQGFIVNISKVKCIKGNEIFFKEKFNSTIPISRRYKKQVINAFEGYLYNNS
ncbi:LytR/AlgR family response regulator transcription factor [Alkaliphilus serpentinus]|nr:response regulator transcription factor [Alkaliphilus serpentinus]